MSNDLKEKERISIANTEMGKRLLKLVSFGLIDRPTGSAPVTSEGATFSESLARRVKVETGGLDALLLQLRDLSKKFGKRSVERLSEPAEALGNWAVGLAPLPDAVIEASNDQYEFKMKQGLALKHSAWAYTMLLSNTDDAYLWYQTDKAQRKAREKKLIYQDPTKFGAQLVEAVGSTDTVTLAVSPKIAAFDNDGKVAKAIEFFAKAALFFDENDLRQAGEMYRNLVGELPEDPKRRIFIFDPNMVLNVIQGRIWGRCSLACRDWRSELVKARDTGADELKQVMAMAETTIAKMAETLNGTSSDESETSPESENAETTA
jgi:hypothetical protein